MTFVVATWCSGQRLHLTSHLATAASHVGGQVGLNLAVGVAALRFEPPEVDERFAQSVTAVGSPA